MKSAYDIVILGAGAAGCAAARACALEHPGASIALIEQGPRRALPATMKIPLLQPCIGLSPTAAPFLRRVRGVPEVNLGDRALLYQRGRGLGGTSLCDMMLYRRPTRADMEAWGSSEWTYDRLLPVWKKLEDNSRGGSEGHGRGGPLFVSDAQRSNAEHAMNVRFFEACEAAGVQAVPDLNDGGADGFSVAQSLVRRGARVQVFESLVEEHSSEWPHLAVLADTKAHRLQWDGMRVTGVEVGSGREQRTISAGKVVVCLGALESPGFLQRSGVGGATGSVVENPAVGQNLIASPFVDVIFSIDKRADVQSKSLSWRNLPYLYRQWREYKEDRTGIFTSLVEGVAHVRSQSTRATPDLSLQFFRTPQLTQEAAWRHPFLDGFTMRVTHHYPRSRGEVLCGKGSLQVRSRALCEREDVLAMDEGIQWAGLLTARDGTLRSVYHVNEQEQCVGPFYSYKAALAHPRTGLATQQDTAAFLAQYAEVSPDVYGTCAMHTVVDEHLRVKGVEGLYVADASVVPAPTVATSTTIALAVGSQVAKFLS